MNIGVVGANGFVGRNVVSSFRSIGMQVKGYGRDQVDLCRPESLANIGEHDVIINCAAYVGLLLPRRRKISYFRSMFRGFSIFAQN